MAKNLLSVSGNQKQKLKNRLSKGAMYAGLIAAVFFVEVTDGSKDPTILDTDGDGIVNIDDLDDDNDGIPDSEECQGNVGSQFSILNGGFEMPVINKNWSYVAVDEVYGWSTTTRHNIIEIWTSGFQGIEAYEGIQFAELNAKNAGSNYQVISTTPGDILQWSFAHRGRASTTVPDVMQVEIGPEGGAFNYSETMSDTKSAWGFYSGTYTVPAGQTETRFALAAVSTATGNISVGNFVDDFQLYSLNNCLADTDGDGIVNSEDLDSDGDGIMDIIEAGGVDLNNDGRVDYQIAGDPTSMLDADQDGLMDEIDNIDNLSGVGEVTSGTPLPLYNTDDNGSPDFLDIDADDDGIVDNTEAQESMSYIAPTGSDTDEDGLDDAYDIDCASCGSVRGKVIEPINAGGSSLPDYRDIDSDGDGALDVIEGHDTNGDGVVNNEDTPHANTGKSNGSDDADGDGLLDGFDNDLINYDATNGGAHASSHPKSNSKSSELDWRASSFFPVEWLDFRVELKGSIAELNWATALELNNEYFEIQRSGSQHEFEPVGKVEGVGTSDDITTYTYEDHGVSQLSEKHLYYRLKQVDIDGTSSFSSTVELLNTIAVENASINVYPNPSTGPVTIDANFEESMRMAHISLFTMNGQRLKHVEISGHQPSINWDLQNLAKGMYIVKLTAGTLEMSRKLVLK